MTENFLLDLASCIEQTKSRKQINADIKTLEKTINMLRLTATLAKGSSKKEINAYIKTLSDQLSTIKLKAKIDSKNLKSEINNVLSKVSFKDIDVLNIDGNKTKLKVQKVIADAKAYAEKNPINIRINYENRRNKLDNDLTAYLNRHTKISESSILLKEADKVRNLIGAINDKKSLREATDAFQLYKSEVSATGFASKSTADRIKSMFGHITKLGGLFSVTSLAVNNFTKSLGTLKDIDDILTEISKTSNLTAQELERLGDISFKSASKYGKTASDYLTGIQEMSRSGFYGEKGTAMTEQSLLAQAAGNMSADVANKYVLATNAAYKFNGEAEKLNAVLDGQNSITNRNSVALSDMAIAMSEAGTVASSYRVSIEDLSAMIGTMESVTKLGGSEVGNGIKAILINLQNVNSSKITDTLDAANASMTEFVNGTEKLRDPISILRDLAETFSKLDEDDALRAEILTNIGGKHQASKLAALLQNMELFDKMLVDYSEGSGSAMEEAIKSANNLSGKLNQIQNSWDSLVNSIVNKNSVLSGLTFGDKLIQGAESFIDTFGEIPVLLTTINTAMTAMKKDYGITQLVNPETKKLDVQGNLMGIDFSAIKEQKKHFEDASIAISDWNCELTKGKTDLDSFNNEVVKNSASLKEYLSTCSKDAPASLRGYKDYLQFTGQATEDLRLQTILLNTALTFLGSIAVQAVITGIANAFDKFNETVVESKEKVDDINSKISELKTQLEELNGLEYKSDFDKQKISQLERELELQEKILEIEQKRLYQNQIGTRFSDYFDGDSLITKQQAEYDHNNKENFANLSRGFDTYTSSLEEIDARLVSLQEKLNSEDLIGHDRFITEGEIKELTEKRNDLLEKQQTIEDQLTVNMGEYLKNYQTAQEAVDSGLLTGSDLEKAESMAEYWNQMYQESADIVTNIQKMNGTYDDTVDKLEEKFGGISRDDLASLSDDDKRVALSFSPDNIIGFEELQQKIAETKGDIEDLNAIEIKTFEEAWTDSFTSEDDKVRELGDSLLELAEKGRLTKETFNEIDSNAGDYFKNLGISADEAVSKINKLVDESKQLSSMSDQISSMSEALSTKLENGFVEADTLSGFDVEVRGLDSWDRFQEVLGSTTSSYEECKEAANALATEWINSSDFLAQLTEENKEYYETQLQAMGVENYEEVISYAQALNEAKEALSQSSLMLGDATQDEIEALISEGAYSELTANMILALYDAKIAEQAVTLDTSADCENLIALAGDTDRTSRSVELLIQLMNIYSGLENGAYDGNRLLREEALAEVSRIKAELEALANGETDGIEMKPTVKLGSMGKSSASKAGKEAADAYLEAFQKEYDQLKDLLDRGEISEAQYLNRLRSLYTRYFKDRKEYLDEYKKYESEYLSGMLNLHNKALSGISTLLNQKISAANDAKDASISALEEEKEAAAEAYQAQIDAIEEEKDAIDDLIKEKDKKIDALNEEADAIQKAAETRKKNIDLQKEEYNLERMLNQRTTAVYKEGKGFVFEADTSGIRDAREKVKEAKEELEIDRLQREADLIQKEIDLLEEKKDALTEEQEAIQKMLDESNKYYDNLIKQQEKMWDSMIKGMEQQKSKWEELANIQEIAEAYSAVQQVFGELGYSVEDVLNGSGSAFEDFKSRYIAIMSDLNQNTSFQEGLEYASGVAKEKFGSIVSDAQNTVQQLSQTFSDGTFSDAISKGVSDGIVAAQQELDNMNQLGNDAGEGFIEGWKEKETEISDATKQTAENAVDAFAEGQDSNSPSEKYKGLAGDAIDGLLLGVEENKQAFIDTIRSLAEEGLLAFEEGFQFDESSIKTSFDSLILLIQSVSEALGFDSEGSVNGLLGALSQLSTFSLVDDGKGILSQFESLKTAVDGVVSAISGGGASGGSTSGSSDKGKGSGTGGGSGLVDAIESFKSATDKALGGGGENGEGEGSEGGGTGAIGQFEQLKTAVDNVTTAIGSEEDEGADNENSDTLIGSIDDLDTSVTDTLGKSGGDGVIGKFEEFRDVIKEAADHVASIYDGLEDIDNQNVECTITINVKMNGSFPQFASGTVLGNMQIESATYNAQYGKAFASGTIGLKQDEKNALRSEYGQPELTVYPNGTTELTTSPVMSDLPKGTVIYNEEQTKKIMDNKSNPVGNAHADGTDDSIWTTLADGT